MNSTMKYEEGEAREGEGVINVNRNILSSEIITRLVEPLYFYFIFSFVIMIITMGECKRTN